MLIFSSLLPQEYAQIQFFTSSRIRPNSVLYFLKNTPKFSSLLPQEYAQIIFLLPQEYAQI